MFSGQWSITLLFSKPVANLMAWNVIIADWSYNLTDYMIVNKEHNGFLQEGSLLSFDMMGHTIGEPPQVIKFKDNYSINTVSYYERVKRET